MEISRLSFTKKTQENMEKDMPVREKGKVLFARLKEMDNDGTLSKAKTRADVARLVGYSEERAKAGYAWVSNLIRRGHLSETIQEWTQGGKIIAEYRLTGSNPDYDYGEVNRRMTKKKVGQELRRWQDKVAAGQIPQAPILDYDTTPQIIERARISNPIKIEITRGDMIIKVEMDSHEEVSKLITTILKGD